MPEGTNELNLLCHKSFNSFSQTSFTDSGKDIYNIIWLIWYRGEVDGIERLLYQSFQQKERIGVCECLELTKTMIDCYYVKPNEDSIKTVMLFLPSPECLTRRGTITEMDYHIADERRCLRRKNFGKRFFRVFLMAKTSNCRLLVRNDPSDSKYFHFLLRRLLAMRHIV